MSPNYLSKLERAAQIFQSILREEAIDGFTGPSPFSQHKRNIRQIKRPTWSVRMIEDAFITNAALSKDRFGEAILPAVGWVAVELEVHQRRRLAMSISPEGIHIHHFEPGKWERWFGADCAGDSAPVRCNLFANDSDPDWQAFMASPLSQWPPRLDPLQFIL